MCTVIETPFVLANLFAHRSGPVSIKQLKKIRRDVEKAVTSVFVDVSTSSICSSIQLYPEMFRWEGEEVARVDGSDDWFEKSYIDTCINARVPSEICDSVVSVIQSARD